MQKHEKANILEDFKGETTVAREKRKSQECGVTIARKRISNAVEPLSARSGIQHA
jgi:hypothetical protein